MSRSYTSGHVLAALHTVKLALTLEIEQNHWSILKNSCISYQLRANGQTCSCQPPYTVDNNEAETGMCTKKLQVAAASVIREVRSSSESTSHCHLKQSLDWKRQTTGLVSQVTGPHTNGLLPMGPH